MDSNIVEDNNDEPVPFEKDSTILVADNLDHLAYGTYGARGIIIEDVRPDKLKELDEAPHSVQMEFLSAMKGIDTFGAGMLRVPKGHETNPYVCAAVDTLITLRNAFYKVTHASDLNFVNNSSPNPVPCDPSIIRGYHLDSDVDYALTVAFCNFGTKCITGDYADMTPEDEAGLRGRDGVLPKDSNLPNENNIHVLNPGEALFCRQHSRLPKSDRLIHTSWIDGNPRASFSFSNPIYLGY